MRLICDGTYFCPNESLVTGRVTMCCCESSRVPRVRFPEALHVFGHVSHMAAVCSRIVLFVFSFTENELDFWLINPKTHLL